MIKLSIVRVVRGIRENPAVNCDNGSDTWVARAYYCDALSSQLLAVSRYVFMLFSRSVRFRMWYALCDCVSARLLNSVFFL